MIGIIYISVFCCLKTAHSVNRIRAKISRVVSVRRFGPILGHTTDSNSALPRLAKFSTSLKLDGSNARSKKKRPIQARTRFRGFPADDKVFLLIVIPNNCFDSLKVKCGTNLDIDLSNSLFSIIDHLLQMLSVSQQVTEGPARNNILV